MDISIKTPEETPPNLDTVENGAMSTSATITEHRTLDITFHGINLSLFGRPILNNIYGEVKGGEILVVMGPSGAGKTSLLNALSGRRPPDTGAVLANGKRMTKHQRRMVGYVEQNDTFVPTLTLLDTLKFTAFLRLPSSMPSKAKMDRIHQVIEILELQKCRNTQIGDAIDRGISNGEKKRTSIACELLTNPALLLMDEPTTGLDANTAYNLMYSIKQFCVKYNKSVIINIHQPSSQIYYLSDKLLLLVNGQVGYYGSSKQVLQHFSSIGLHSLPHYNPADFVMDCARGEPGTVQKMIDAATLLEPKFEDDKETEEVISETETHGFDNQALEADEDVTHHHTRRQFSMKDEFLLQDVDEFYDPDSKYQSSYAMQLLVLTIRQLKIYLRQIIKPLNLIAMALISVIVLSLFAGTETVEDSMRERLGYMYFLHIWIMFNSAFASVLVQIACFPVIFKERMSSAYHLSALCIAVFISDLALVTTIQLVTGLVGYWTTGYRSVSTFFLLVFVLLAFSACITALSMFLFTSLNDIPSALLAAILSCLFGFLISGYIINPLPLWAQWMKYLVPLGYAYNAVIHQYLEQDFMVACSNQTSAFEDCNMGLIEEFESSRLLVSYPWVIPVWANVLLLLFVASFLRSMNYVMMRYWRTPLNMILKKPSKLKVLKERVMGKKAGAGGPPWGAGPPNGGPSNGGPSNGGPPNGGPPYGEPPIGGSSNDGPTDDADSPLDEIGPADEPPVQEEMIEEQKETDLEALPEQQTPDSDSTDGQNQHESSETDPTEEPKEAEMAEEPGIFSSIKNFFFG